MTVVTVTETLTLVNKVGLHARPAGMFVQTEARFSAAIRVSCNGRVADAKRILQVEAEGDDAPEALVALAALVRDRFGEPE